MIVQGVIFFCLEMPVNINQYQAAIGVFNNCNLITNNFFFCLMESSGVGINLLFISANNVMVLFLFFFMFVVSAHQKKKIKKIRFKLILLSLLMIGFCLYHVWLHIHLVNLNGVVEKKSRS